MKKCKIKSIKPLGKQKTYNVTMKSKQHNYKMVDIASGCSVITSNSHSCAYAFLAYQTAYLKIHYPLEFMCALLTSELMDRDKLNLYIREAKRMKIVTKATHINKSGLIFTIEKGLNKKGEEYEFLRAPFTALKGVGAKAVVDIVDNQPYKNLEDFVHKITGRLVNKRVVEALIDAGSMMEAFRVGKDDLMVQYPEIKKKVDKQRKAIEKQKKKEAEYEGSLFDEFDFSGDDIKV